MCVVCWCFFLCAQHTMDEEIQRILLTIDTSKLDKDDDWGEVVEQIESLKYQWRTIGRYLHVKPDRINEIARNHPQDSDACLGECVLEWLKGNYNTKKFGEPSWSRLAKVVVKLDNDLFKKISEAHKTGIQTSGPFIFDPTTYPDIFSESSQETLPCALENILEFQQPCLGRQFKVGMYYDSHKDNLILGINITVPEINVPQVSFNYELIPSDSLQDKALQLGLTPELHLSLLAGLVQDISGSAMYWNDQLPSKRVARVCLKYESTSYIKQVEIEKLVGIQHHMFEGATHVVTKVLYGLKVFFIFDRVLSQREAHDCVHRNMVKMVSSLSSISESATEDNSLINDIMANTEEVQKYQCKVYSDSNAPTNPCTLPEAVEFYRSLPNAVIRRDENQQLAPIPQKVWLYPLSKLDEKCRVIVRSIGDELIDQVQSMLDILHNFEIQASDILSKHDDVLSKFHHLKDKLVKFSELIKMYGMETSKDIAEILPQIREQKVGEAKLARMVEDTNASPFDSHCLSSWLTQIDEEIKTLQTLYDHVSDMQFASSREIQSIVEAIGSDYVVCFAFNLGVDEDYTLKNMQLYLQNETERPLSSASQPHAWYANTDIVHSILHHIKQFKIFANMNETKGAVKFLVTNASHDSDSPGSILLYEGTTSKLWEPPSAPGKPTISNVTCDTVELRWAKAKYGSESVQCYSVYYHSLDNSQELQKCTLTSSAKEHISVGGLKPKTSYTFTVQAVCCCGVGGESEASDPVVTRNCSLPGKPIVQNTRHDSVQLEWTKPEVGIESIYRYKVLYRALNDPENDWTPKTTSGIEESITITGLTPETKYVFKVQPELTDGIGTESDISNEIMTKALICQPGKPIKCTVTHNSIELKWSKPEVYSNDIQCYLVYYRPVDSSQRFKSKSTENEEEMTTITGLLFDTSYVFKVLPLLEDGVGTYSELSDPIKTKATSPPVNLKACMITSTSVTLQWTKPEYGSEYVTSYTILYHPIEEFKDHKLTVGTDETAVVSRLQPSKKYVFKVQPNTSSIANVGSISEPCDPVETKPMQSDMFPQTKVGDDGHESEDIRENTNTRAVCKPGMIKATKVTHDCIMLQWGKPEDLSENVEYYDVSYSTIPGKSKTACTNGPERSTTITGLQSSTNYNIQVSPRCKTGTITEIQHCIIRTKTDAFLAEKVQRKCHVDSRISNDIEVYNLPVMYDIETPTVTKCHVTIGDPKSIHNMQEKVVLLVGATGEGKTTLINSIANYIYGVQWEHKFRFKLITESDELYSQVYNETRKITAYTIIPVHGSPLNYTLTIVDTPGLGIILERDKTIIKEILSVKSPNSIDHIDAIGLVVCGSLPRLTPLQKYVFDLILDMFGKDFASNIFLMCTFAFSSLRQEPPIVQAIREAEIDFNKVFKFDNYALFTKPDVSKLNIDKLCWEMNCVNLESFFSILASTVPQSLQLTREIMKTQETLQENIQELQKQLSAGLDLIQDLLQEQEFVQKHAQDLGSIQNHLYEVKQVIKVPAADGQGFATNCSACNFTCHYPCTTDNKKLYKCAAMGGSWLFRNEQSFCQRCPGKCSWEQHVHEQFRYRIVKETQTFEDLIKRHAQERESDKEETAEKVKSETTSQLHEVTTQVLDLIIKSHQYVQILERNALKPSSLDKESYIDSIIKSQQRNKTEGLQQQISALEGMKQQALVLNQTKTIKKEDINSDSWWKVWLKYFSKLKIRSRT